MKASAKRPRKRDPVYMREQRRKYNQSEKGRAGRARYAKTAKGKARLQRSEQRNRWPRWILKTYGLTVEAYAWMLYHQNFACAICDQTFSNKVVSAKNQAKEIRPCVEHNHATGEVRGLVCGWCNYNLIGPIEQGHERTKRVLEYLGWEVLAPSPVRRMA